MIPFAGFTAMNEDIIYKFMYKMYSLNFRVWSLNTNITIHHR